MRLEVLISCMHEKDYSIVERTNIQTDVVVVNQCDTNSIEEYTFVNNKKEECRIKFICTTERGLSRSRNMAIRNATGDVCLICDDDEVLADDYEDKILGAYTKYPSMNCILFMIERRDMTTPKKYPVTESVVGFKQIMQSSSVQITFRRDDIINNGIVFDHMLGSGSGNGGGEENKFLLDIKHKGMKIYYVPANIGKVMPGKSLWFNGFDKQYMKNQGWSSRRSLGNVTGLLYSIVFWAKHLNMIRKDMPVFKSLIYIIQGYFEKRKDLA